MITKTFDDATIESVWRKGKIVPGQDSAKIRKDVCGATIWCDRHGNRNSTFGWEIDHIDPNGSDNLINLQPLQWENNVAKSDSGRLKCVVTS
jgi:hypothetical protein